MLRADRSPQFMRADRIHHTISLESLPFTVQIIWHFRYAAAHPCIECKICHAVEDGRLEDFVCEKCEHDLSKRRYHEERGRFYPKYYLTELLIKHHGKCAYCDLEIGGSDGVSIDHVIPRSRGGALGIENCVLCCLHCNSSKGDLTGDEYRKWLRTPAGSTLSQKWAKKDPGYEWGE